MNTRRTTAKARVRVMVEVDCPTEFNDGLGDLAYVYEAAQREAIGILKSIDGVKVLGEPETMCVITEQVKP